LVHRCAGIQSLGVIRLDCKRFIDIFKRALILTFLCKFPAYVVIRPIPIRIKFNSTIIVGDCPVGIAFVGVGKTSAGIGPGFTRLETDESGEVRDGSVVVPLVVVGIGAAGIGGGIIRVNPDGLVEVRDGSVVVPFKPVDIATDVIGESIIWVYPDSLSVVRDGRS